MVSSGEEEVVIQKFSEFSSKCRSKLGTTIRNDFVIESKAKEDLVEEEESNAFGSDGFLSQ